MRTTLAALAGASVALAAYSPDSYSNNSPPAYGGDESSSSSSPAGPTSYPVSTSSYVTSTSSSVASPPSSTPDFPSCWSSCFKEAGVSSPSETCNNEELSSCIEDSCSDEEAEKYESWYAEECGSTSTSSDVVGPTGSMSVSHGPSGYPTSSSLTGYPHGPSSYSHGGPSGYVPSSSGIGGGYGNCTTTYSSVCTETETLIYRSSTEYKPTTITHIFTTSLPSGSCSNVPYPITSSSSVPYSPVTTSGLPSYPAGGEGPSTLTNVETIYTTVCPYTETTVSEGVTVTNVYQTTSEVTSTYQTTTPTPVSPVSDCWGVCFVKNGATDKEAACTNGAVEECIKELCSAAESAQFEAWLASDDCSSEGGNGGDLPTESAGGNQGAPTEYTSISPVTKPFTYGEWTSYYTDFETVTLTSYATVSEGGAVPTGGYSSPPEGSNTEGSPTGGYAVTKTPVYEIPVTTAYTTVCGASDSTGLTTSTVTTTSTISLTFTVTTTEASSSGTPTGSPIDSCWAKCFAENGVTSEASLCGDIDIETCIKASCPIDSYNAYECWLGDYCGVPTTTSSGVVGPTGTGVIPTGGYPHPSGTGVGPTGTGVGPTGTGVGPTTTQGLPPTTTGDESCATPTPSKECKRCEGQGEGEFCGFDINTNIYTAGNAPITCDTVEYNWEITTGLISPDGVERMAILINGQSPGPMLEANWGDEIIVHVKNSMPAADLNGTTIHWHGIHQKGTPEFDGTPSLSQCPIAPGETFTYKFRATQYGSSWYHSHFALQAYDGLYGPMVIKGPVQEGYEYDGEEFIALQDWRHAPLSEIYHNLELVSNGQRSSPTLDNALINGMNTWENGGKRWSMTVTKGKTYRLRVLNAAVQSTFKFYIDGHSFKVIAADFVPIEPFETNIIDINNGQRYDVIFTADQDSGNYWMRSDVQSPCSNVTNGLDVKAIVHYDDAPVADPTSTAYTYTPECVDMPAASLVPIVPWNAGASSNEIQKDVLIQPNGGNPNLFKWTLSGTAFFSQWSDPTLQSIYDDGTVPTYSGDLAIREDNLGEWIYVIIDSVIPLPHPIHLHGHDFLVLGQGIGPYDPSTAVLNLQNPPRRDTAIMPFQLGPGAVGGYLVVAFYTDNPGVWLMHCHIGWHNAMGFALQIIEGLADIKDTVEYSCQMNENCEAWHAYADQYGIQTTDSGI